jgi:hypothetical protein
MFAALSVVCFLEAIRFEVVGELLIISKAVDLQHAGSHLFS